MKKVIISGILGLGIVLSGCASSLNNQETKSLVLSRCPSLKQYSRETMQRAAQSIKNLPDDSELIEILGDYSRLREACRIAERKIRAIQ
jgi:hypothetical protein